MIIYDIIGKRAENGSWCSIICNRYIEWGTNVYIQLKACYIYYNSTTMFNVSHCIKIKSVIHVKYIPI